MVLQVVVKGTMFTEMAMKLLIQNENGNKVKESSIGLLQHSRILMCGVPSKKEASQRHKKPTNGTQTHLQVEDLNQSVESKGAAQGCSQWHKSEKQLACPTQYAESTAVDLSNSLRNEKEAENFLYPRKRTYLGQRF
ncbi:hypothetical protein pdam_00010184 [Pocillopora damicornis]|uniref:Uncharacterized protein n=1 Tax=Pocillopora damicornis TaxID=46731 RepID=A0A3M6T425_POCDA|nr:hypothetical protein pdam_00010184 [Pocillopora damicornis]